MRLLFVGERTVFACAPPAPRRGQSSDTLIFPQAIALDDVADRDVAQPNLFADLNTIAPAFPGPNNLLAQLVLRRRFQFSCVLFVHGRFDTTTTK